jgi:hypothetical protein
MEYNAGPVSDDDAVMFVMHQGEKRIPSEEGAAQGALRQVYSKARYRVETTGDDMRNA